MRLDSSLSRPILIIRCRLQGQRAGISTAKSRALSSILPTLQSLSKPRSEDMVTWYPIDAGAVWRSPAALVQKQKPPPESPSSEDESDDSDGSEHSLRWNFRKSVPRNLDRPVHSSLRSAQKTLELPIQKKVQSEPIKATFSFGVGCSRDKAGSLVLGSQGGSFWNL